MVFFFTQTEKQKWAAEFTYDNNINGPFPSYFEAHYGNEVQSFCYEN